MPRRLSHSAPSQRSRRDSGGDVHARRSSQPDEDESGDAFPPAPPPSEPHTSRTPAPMLGTMMPQDSMRSRGKPRLVLANSQDAKLVAAAGLDLFRQSLAFDGVQPQHHAPRHPAVTPNLHAIQEDSDTGESSGSVADGVSDESQAILVFGSGPLRSGGELNACVANRVEAAVQLYWRITKVFAEQQASSLCYLVPMADDSGSDSVRENEAIRSALAAAGISPHHIIMDCSAPNVIDNTVLLVPVLRHLHVETVHVVTSAFQQTRVCACVDGVLRAARDMAFRTRYHAAPDGLRASERAQREKLESVTLLRTHEALERAIRAQREGSTPGSGGGRSASRRRGSASGSRYGSGV